MAIFRKELLSIRQNLTTMAIELYEHQKVAIEKLKNGSILCGGVGSGKSRTALSYFYFKECNGSMKINGKGDYSKANNPMDLYIITTARKRDTKEWESECVPFVFSLSGINVKIDSWNNIKKYSDVSGAFFIFDEQRVVGSGAWVKAFLKITKLNRWILLSATPGDTWMDYIPVFVANGFYKNRTEFIRRHVVYSRFAKYPKVERYLDTGRLLKLQRSIMVNMRYSKRTVVHEETIKVGYDKDIYNTVLTKRWNVFENKPIKDISQLCYLLRRVVNSDPSRIEAIKKLISKYKRVIIFYNFDYELDILRKIGSDLKIAYSEWNGHNHQPIPKTDEWIYLVQYTAGAEGWNCITTNVIIFYSQNYSYKAMVQAAGRIDRINTPFVDLYNFYARSNATIDIAIERCLKRKENFNESRFLSE